MQASASSARATDGRPAAAIAISTVGAATRPVNLMGRILGRSPQSQTFRKCGCLSASYSVTIRHVGAFDDVGAGLGNETGFLGSGGVALARGSGGSAEALAGGG